MNIATFCYDKEYFEHKRFYTKMQYIYKKKSMSLLFVISIPEYILTNAQKQQRFKS